MDKRFKDLLKEFSNNEETLDRIIVSTFVISNNISVKKNKLIKSFLIKKNDTLAKYIINSTFTFDDLIEAFESIVSEKEKVINGAVYTPNHIKNFIVDSALKRNTKNLETVIIGDISCGCGAFLYTVSNYIRKSTNRTFHQIFAENIWGLDISKYSIKRTKILLTLLAISLGEEEKDFKFNLFIDDALRFDWKQFDPIKNNGGFDIIVGNPPYVRAKNINIKTKLLLEKWDTAQSGNPDLYIPFFEIGLRNLNTNGILGYITVNTFYKSINARGFRDFMLSNKYEIEIIDFGNEKVFPNKSVYTCICLLSTKKVEHIGFLKTSSLSLLPYNQLNFTQISYKDLEIQKGWLLSEKHIIDNINKIERCGKSIGKSYKIKNGIATLSNHIFIFKPIKEEEKYYIIQQGDKEYKIEKTICRDIIKPNTLKYEHEISIKKEKIIFPYKKGSPILTTIEEGYFKKHFPQCYKYLLAHKAILQNRDKGHGDYEKWFSFGRTQALTDIGYKLLFPYIGKKPFFVLTTEVDLLIYCGYAIFSKSKKDLQILKKILESSVFEYYIKNSSKPYSGGYFSYAKNYIKDFSIPELSIKEKQFLVNEKQQLNINKFLIKKYDLIIKN